MVQRCSTPADGVAGAQAVVGALNMMLMRTQHGGKMVKIVSVEWLPATHTYAQQVGIQQHIKLPPLHRE